MGERDLLVEVDGVLRAEEGPGLVLERLGRLLTAAMDVERCIVSAVEGDLLRTIGGVSMGFAAPECPPLPRGRGIISRCARTRAVQRVADVLRDPDYVASMALVRSELAVPVVRGVSVLGVLNFEAHRLAAFDDDDERLACAVAERLAAWPGWPAAPPTTS
jgi:GAF domain-containing protein